MLILPGAASPTPEELPRSRIIIFAKHPPAMRRVFLHSSHILLAFLLLMLFTRSMLVAMNTFVSSSTILAQAYGTGVYGCGPYEVGCTQSSTTPSAPNTGMLLSEPSFVIPGSLLLAVLLAIISTSIIKLIRRKKTSRL